jgi:hypothetical protein
MSYLLCSSQITENRSYSTILTAYWDQPAPSYFNGSEDTPEYDRRKKVGFVMGWAPVFLVCLLATP